MERTDQPTPEPSPDRRPRENTIVSQPATVTACQQDRANAQGQDAAINQLAEARTHGNEQAGTR